MYDRGLDPCLDPDPGFDKHLDFVSGHVHWLSYQCHQFHLSLTPFFAA